MKNSDIICLMVEQNDEAKKFFLWEDNLHEIKKINSDDYGIMHGYVFGSLYQWC